MGGFKQVFAGFFYDILNIPMLLMRALRHWDAPWAVKPGWVHRDPGDEMLFVLFHGTNQSELLFRFAIAHFQQAVPPRCSYYAPFLKHHCNGPIENYAGEALHEIETWNRTHPGGRIAVVGCSNGGRIAMYVAEKIETPLRVLAVGAPLRGTAALDVFPTSLIQWRLGPELFRELSEGKACPTPLQHEYRSVAASSDQYVFPVDRTRVYKDPDVLDHVGHTALMVHDVVLDTARRMFDENWMK